MEAGDLAAVRRALAAGADVDALDQGPDGVTPLHLAAALGNVPVILALLEAGASVDAASDYHRFTPLHYAAKGGRAAAVAAL